MSITTMADLSDQILVGGPGANADFLQNVYGMYIRKDQMLSTDQNNIEIAVTAHHHLYKPVIATSLEHTPAKDNVSKESISTMPTSNMYRINRDWKDALVQMWKTWEPEMSWEEFRDSPIGFSLVRDFEADVAGMVFEMEVSYEDMMASPQSVLSSFIHSILPQEDNPDQPMFGMKKRVIDQDVIDQVITDSNIRSLRDCTQGYLESVGIHKEWLTQEQSEEVDEFVSSL